MSDWSSDVCSSDLRVANGLEQVGHSRLPCCAVPKRPSELQAHASRAVRPHTPSGIFSADKYSLQPVTRITNRHGPSPLFAYTNINVYLSRQHSDSHGAPCANTVLITPTARPLC